MSAPNLAYIILYVPDVASTLAFYERAFDLERRFVHASGTYAELETGGTALAFCDEASAPARITRSRRGADAPAFEIAFVVDDVEAAFGRAVDAGAEGVAAPEQKPWGQTVAYVADDNGVLVELCTAVER
jgi:lactoylglutathione lyase